MSAAPPARGIAQLIESDGPGGAERMLAELSAALSQRGDRCVAFLPRNGEGWLARELAGAGVTIEHFDLARIPSAEAVWSLARAFRRHGVRVVHSHEFSMACCGAAAAWLARTPHVITMHGGRYWETGLHRRLALRSAVSASAAVVAVSESVALSLSAGLHLAPRRVAVIPNGARPVRHAVPTLRAEIGAASDDLVLLAIGSLYPVKGHHILLDALASLGDMGRTVRVAIAGRGGARDALERQSRTLRIADRVHLLGLRDDVAALLAGADVFVMPSLAEGLPVALLEAMLAAKPIVASDVGEIGHALRDGAGVLVPPGQPDALATALRMVVTDATAARALGARASHRVHAEFTLDRMLDRYVQLYDTIASRSPVSA